jgi:hypothetical protein
MQEKLHFKISSALKDIIGRDLITNDFVAIFELVKNSYDAHVDLDLLVKDIKNVIVVYRPNLEDKIRELLKF